MNQDDLLCHEEFSDDLTCYEEFPDDLIDAVLEAKQKQRSPKPNIPSLFDKPRSQVRDWNPKTTVFGVTMASEPPANTIDTLAWRDWQRDVLRGVGSGRLRLPSAAGTLVTEFTCIQWSAMRGFVSGIDVVDCEDHVLGTVQKITAAPCVFVEWDVSNRYFKLIREEMNTSRKRLVGRLVVHVYFVYGTPLLKPYAWQIHVPY